MAASVARPVRWDRLTAAPFLAALLLLLINDFLFKAAYHNWLTGKLSDVAGLFAWTFFWCVVLPARSERWRGVAISNTFSPERTTGASGCGT